MLVAEGPVAVFPTPVVHRGHRAGKAAFGRYLPDHALPVPRPSPNMGQAEEVEGGPIRRRMACVYTKPPFAGPEQVLEYGGRYTHRVAISNNRLRDIDDGNVRFTWKDYRHHDQPKIMILSADEFIRRFLLHVLPRGFHHIRYYGLLGNRHRERNSLAAAGCSA